MFTCPDCPATFSRRYNRDKHFTRNHGGSDRVHDCVLCGAVFLSVTLLHEHILDHEPETEYHVTRELMDGALTTYRKNYVPPEGSLDLTFGQDIDNLTQVMAVETARKKYAKCSIVLTVEFIQLSGNEVTNSIVIYMRSPNFTITPFQDHASLLAGVQAGFNVSIEDFKMNGSNYILNAIYRTEIDFAKCSPLSGSCGILSISSKADLKQLHENGDNRCFFYAVARHFTKIDDMELIKRFLATSVITDGIRTPVSICSIPKFEKKNHHLKIRVNVLYEEDGNIFPIFASKYDDVDGADQKIEFVNILLYKTLINGEAVSHYSYISDLPKLLRRRYEKNSGKAGYSYQVTKVCPNCLTKFFSDYELETHFGLCKENKPQKIILPQPGTYIEFKNWNNKFKIPMCAFFDFESSMKVSTINLINLFNIKLFKILHK